MTFIQDITIIRNCTTSQQLFSVAASLSHQALDIEDMLNNAVHSDHRDKIESLLGQLAVKRYAYKFAYDAASDMEEDEWQYQNELEINDAMMGDRV